MAAITIRNLSDEVHRALKARATRNGRSTEAEVRRILEEAVQPPDRIKLGSALAEIGRRAGFRDDDLVFVRDRTPVEPIGFE